MEAHWQINRWTERWQRWFTAGLVLLFVGLSVQYTIKITGSERDNRSAFLRWRDQIRDVETGVNIYDEHNYPNPPIMALLLQPLVSLPPLAGSLLWFYLKVGMAFLVFYWVFRLVENPEKPFPVWAKILALVLSLRPIMGDLTHGNINIFILFLVVAALYSYRGKQNILAGLLLGLAIACKVTPALFLPYFAWKRSWHVLAGCALGLVLFLWAVPAAFLGSQHNSFLLTRWVDQMILPYVAEGQVTTEHQNQSLPGLVYRFFTPGPSFSSYNGETYVPVEYHNIMDLDPIFPQIFLKLCMLVFAGFIVWSCRTPTGQRRTWRLAAEFSLVILGMLLFSERTWKHHCVTLILPFTVLVYALATVPMSVRLRRYYIGTLLAVVLLIGSTSSGLFGSDADGLAKMAQVYGAYVWANLLLVASLIVLLRQAAHPMPAYQPPHRIMTQRITDSANPGLPDAKNRLEANVRSNH